MDGGDERRDNAKNSKEKKGAEDVGDRSGGRDFYGGTGIVNEWDGHQQNRHSKNNSQNRH